MKHKRAAKTTALAMAAVILVGLFGSTLLVRGSGAHITNKTELGTLDHYNGFIINTLEGQQADIEGAAAVGNLAYFASRSGFSYDVGAAASSKYIKIGSYNNPNNYPSLLLNGTMTVGKTNGKQNSVEIYGGPFVINENKRADYEAGDQIRQAPKYADAAITDAFFAESVATVERTVRAISIANTKKSFTSSQVIGWGASASVFNNHSQLHPDNLEIPSSTNLDLDRVAVINVTSSKVLTINVMPINRALIDAHDLIIFNFVNAESVTFDSNSIYVSDGAGTLNTSAPAPSAANDAVAEVAGKVVFNFPQASDIFIQNCGVVGSVLAPGAYVEGLGGSINGMLVADSMKAREGFELHAFKIKKEVFDFGNKDEQVEGSVTLYKTETGSGPDFYTYLKEAVFALYEADQYGAIANNTPLVKDVKTDRYGYLHIGDLPEGYYVLQETSPPPGYTIEGTGKYVFAVTAENPDFVFQAGTVENARMTLDVSLVKLDAETNAPIMDAGFTLYKSHMTDRGTLNMEIVADALTSGSDGTFGVAGLEEGFYYLLETGVPDGYEHEKANVYQLKVYYDATADELKLEAHHLNIDLDQYDLNSLEDLENATDVEKTLLTRHTGTGHPIIYNYPADTPEGRLVLMKTDEDGTHALQGARYRLEKEEPAGSNSYVYYGSYTTNAFGMIEVDGLPEGVYRIQETKAPAGYQLPSPNPYFTFTIDKDGTTATSGLLIEKTFTNKAITTDLTLTKVDADNTSITLQDARFYLYRSTQRSGKLLFSLVEGPGPNSTFATNASGKLYLDELRPGFYYLVEARAANGYELPSDTVWQIAVELTAGGTAAKVTAMYELGLPDGFDWDAEQIENDETGITRKAIDLANPQIKNVASTGGLVLHKTGDDGTLLAGVEFVLTHPGGATTTHTTNALGVLEVYGLRYGSYNLREVTPPAGYSGAFNRDFVIGEGNAPNEDLYHEFEAENNLDTIDIQLKKVSEMGNVPLENAEFSLYQYYRDGAGYGLELLQAGISSGSGGLINITGVSIGTYYLIETKAPEGHVLNKAVVYQIQVYHNTGSNGLEYTVDLVYNYNLATGTGEIIVPVTDGTIYNNVEPATPTGSITLQKYDEDTHSALAGATFALYKKQPGGAPIAPGSITLPKDDDAGADADAGPVTSTGDDDGAPTSAPTAGGSTVGGSAPASDDATTDAGADAAQEAGGADADGKETSSGDPSGEEAGGEEPTDAAQAGNIAHGMAPANGVITLAAGGANESEPGSEAATGSQLENTQLESTVESENTAETQTSVESTGNGAPTSGGDDAGTGSAADTTTSAAAPSSTNGPAASSDTTSGSTTQSDASAAGEAGSATPAGDEPPQGAMAILPQNAPVFAPTAAAAPTIPGYTHVATETTNSMGFLYFDDLAAGTYKVVEIEAPEGYIALDQDAPGLQGDITLSDAVSTLDMHYFLPVPNKADLPAPIDYTLTKTSDDGVTPLPGAQFHLYRSGRSLQGGLQLTLAQDTPITSDAQGLIHLTGLEEGYYYLLETQAPAGYQPLEYAVQIAVAVDAQTNQLVATPYKVYFNNIDLSVLEGASPMDKEPLGNAPIINLAEIQYGDLVVQKYDSANYEGVQGTYFELFEADAGYNKTNPGTVFRSGTTRYNGRLQFSDLPAGHYVLEEVTPAPGYMPSTPNSWEILIEASSGVTDVLGASIAIKNDPVVMDLNFIKVAAQENTLGLEGAEFSLYKSAKNDDGTLDFTLHQASLHSAADGTFTLNNLTQGNYYLVETHAPEGYWLEHTYKVVQIKITLDAATNGLTVASVRELYLPHAAEYDLDNLVGVENDASVTYKEIKPIENSTPALYPIENELKPSVTGRYILQKLGQDGLSLSGAQFTLRYRETAPSPAELTDPDAYAYHSAHASNAFGYVVINSLKVGYYYLEETTPPAGYGPAENETGIRTFAILDDGVTTEVTEYGEDMRNAPLVSAVRAVKFGDDTNAPLEDTIFTLYAWANKPPSTLDGTLASIAPTEIETKGSDGDGVVEFTNLSHGWYTIREIDSTYGYDAQVERVTDENGVDIPDGDIFSVTFNEVAFEITGGTGDVGDPYEFQYMVYNPLLTGDVEITKYVTALPGEDSTGWQPNETALANVQFQLYRTENIDGTGSYIPYDDGTGNNTYKTDAAGKLVIKELPVGRYRLEESYRPPAANGAEYIGPLRVVLFSVTPDETHRDVEPIEDFFVYNYTQTLPTVPSASINVHKVNEDDTTEALGGAWFRLYKRNGDSWPEYVNDRIYYTNASGELTINGLVEGSYRLVEVRAPGNFGFEESGPPTAEFTVAFAADETPTLTLDAVSGADITASGAGGGFTLHIPNTTSPQVPGLELYKVDGSTYDRENQFLTPLPGAEFRLYHSVTGNEGTYNFYGAVASNAVGQITLPYMVEGYYKLVEETAPDGYLLKEGGEDANTYEFRVWQDADGAWRGSYAGETLSADDDMLYVITNQPANPTTPGGPDGNENGNGGNNGNNGGGSGNTGNNNGNNGSGGGGGGDATGNSNGNGSQNSAIVKTGDGATPQAMLYLLASLAAGLCIAILATVKAKRGAPTKRKRRR